MNYLIIRTIAILIASYITGVGVPITFAWQTGLMALLLAIILAVINHTIKPFIDFISLPINFFSLGLFSLVINGVMVLMASYILTSLAPHFTFVIPSFLMAVWFSVVLSVVNWVLHIFE